MNGNATAKAQTEMTEIVSVIEARICQLEEKSVYIAQRIDAIVGPREQLQAQKLEQPPGILSRLSISADRLALLNDYLSVQCDILGKLV
jgi:hypothetical protein